MNCNFCSRSITNPGGLKVHEIHCQSNPDRTQRIKSPNAHAKKGCKTWNKGLKGIKTGGWNKGTKGLTTGKANSPEKEKERRRKISEYAKLHHGGYKPGSGRGKKGLYKGFFCDSSWELAFVIYCLDHHIDIKRNTQKFDYVYNGKQKKYIPDFVVDGVMTEIKGYKTEEWLAKLEYNPSVKVLYENDLTHVFEYVINNYGKQFIDLYEQIE